MIECSVLQIDAFTTTSGQGNPAGVVLNGDDYTSDQMQKIARKVGFNETVFLCSSMYSDIKLRYFTPGHETPLCGHATVGGIFALLCGKESQKLTIETGAGLLSIKYNSRSKEITMRQAEPVFISFSGDRQKLCESLNISLKDLHPSLPIQYGNTGSWTLLVPVAKPEFLDKMVPVPDRFPDILSEKPKSSIHPFAIIQEQQARMTARHFSSPFSGTKEDSVTGTASGVMGAYSLNHIYKEDEKRITVLQGKHVNKAGLVSVYVKRGTEGRHEVSISGTACYNKEFKILLEP